MLRLQQLRQAVGPHGAQRCGRSWDGWWEHLEDTVYGELQAVRHEAEAATAQLTQQHAEQRAIARASTTS